MTYMKRMVSMLLCCALLLSVLPTAVGAAGISGRHPAEAVVCNSASYGAAGGEASPRAFAYKTMKSSDKLLSLIMDCEGFSATPYWDYSQWTIGYGTFCGYTRAEVPAEYWSGISRAKGKELLVDYMRKHAEAEVNRFFKGLGRQPLQQQFDAVVDFTYALGSSWMYEDSRIKAWLKKPTTDLELMRAMGAWCRVDGKVNTDTCDRRIREALIYLDGLYLLPHGTVGGGLATVPKGKLPVFRYVVYQGNGTAINGSRTDDVNYYLEGGSYDTVLTPARSGYVFGGWQRSDGSLLLPGQPVKENLTVRAKWTNHPFRDVPKNAWYSLPVAYCYDNGIMNGAYATKFLPDGAASRAMAVTVLYRMAGEPKVSEPAGWGMWRKISIIPMR